MQTGDTAEGGDDERVVSSLRDVESVLVLSDSMDPEARASYYETLLPDDPPRPHVLAIEYTRGPDGWLDEWREHVGHLPAETAIVSVNDATRSAASSAVGPTAYGGDGTESTISTVESPDDLTGLGIAVGEHLKRWEGSAGPRLLTLDSLTVLLGYVDLKRTFRFLHVMVNRVKGAGGVGHYHMDPAAHDDRTVATLASVFDAVARYEDGEWRITTR
jgi:hypothetical protein